MNTNSTSSGPVRSLLLVAVAFVTLVVASCGGEQAQAGVASLDDAAGADSGDGSSEAAAISEEEALLAFAQCMRDNGVEMEDPTGGGDGRVFIGPPPGVDGGEGTPQLDETTRAAFEACGTLLEGVQRGFDEADQTERQDQQLEFARCMRDNGIDMPDPDFSAEPGDGRPGNLFGQIDPSDPDFAAAQEACSDILGFPGGGPLFGGDGPATSGDDDA